MRYIRLRGYLKETLRGFPDLGLVVYDQAHHRGGAATEYALGCAATVQTWCAERAVEHAAAHSGTVKKWATRRASCPSASCPMTIEREKNGRR